MVERLRLVVAGRLQPTPYDLRFYTHELREYVRYRQLGYRTGAPVDDVEAHALWNSTHTATLEDYGINEKSEPLFHPNVMGEKK